MNCKACGLPIDEHEAGRKLDACVAEAVFEREPMNGRHGLHSNGDIEYHWGYPVGHSVAGKYSTDIAATWQVVEKLSFNHVQVDKTDDRTDLWYCAISLRPRAQSAFAPTAPLAICLAALKAVSK